MKAPVKSRTCFTASVHAASVPGGNSSEYAAVSKPDVSCAWRQSENDTFTFQPMSP